MQARLTGHTRAKQVIPSLNLLFMTFSGTCGATYTLDCAILVCPIYTLSHSYTYLKVTIVNFFAVLGLSFCRH